MARSFKLRSNKVPNVFHTRLQGKHVLENGKLHIYIYCEKNYFWFTYANMLTFILRPENPFCQEDCGIQNKKASEHRDETVVFDAFLQQTSV